MFKCALHDTYNTLTYLEFFGAFAANPETPGQAPSLFDKCPGFFYVHSQRTGPTA